MAAILAFNEKTGIGSADRIAEVARIAKVCVISLPKHKGVK